ncbi:unnamed protein product [Peniophora sp. CBMAI 1063]|nr:unnamed protein product [Peniophora sp. CBMAI 1063]
MPIAIPDVFQPRGQSLTTYLLSHRVFLYTLASTVALSATIANALANHSNFYSVAVYLSKSGRSVLVLVNFALLLALGVARMIQHVFFGSLRPMEVERLYDRVWFFVTESLLAFTIFRDEFDIPFGVMFLFLLFVKSFHWLLSDRVEWMNQMPFPGPPTLFHVRIVTLFVVLYLTDAVMILFAIDSVQTKGVGAIVLFASEYAILIASAVNSLAKYTLCAYEHRRAAVRGGENAPPWENKSMYTFYIDLFTDFWKLVTYLGFFVIVITFYGVPLNVVRDVYVTARSFITRLRDLLRYRAATRNMDERYPNATETELTAMSDAACIICREEMVAQTATAAPDPTAEGDGPNMTPKKLPCGHIFHFHCLRSWLERQQSCPTCRRGVLDGSPATPNAGQAPEGGQANEDEQALPGLRAGNIFRAFFGVPPAPVPAQAPAPQAAPQVAQQPVQAPPARQHGLPIPPASNPGQHSSWPAGTHQPQQLQPPPVFQGFYGPRREWQPWPVSGQLQAPLPPTDTTRPEAPETGSSTASSQTEPNPPSSDGAVLPPREAAAAAALRRLTGGTAPIPVESSSSSTPAGRPPPSTGSAPNATAISTNLPSLIPLFALSPIQRTGQPSASYIPPQHHHWSQYSQRPPLLSAPMSDPHLSSWPSQTPPPPPQHLPSLTQLPQTLSDEQLQRLDRLTREAIDERLRVLENVSTALQRSIDELARVRSVLPPSSASTPMTTRTGTNPPSTDSKTDTVSAP